MSLAFLMFNGVRVRASDAGLVELIIGIAEGVRTKADVAVFLREHSAPAP